MHGQELFLQAFVYLMAAVISVPIAKRLGLGSVLGYLIAGAIIGPFGLALVGEDASDVMHFAEFGVVMMLFLVGLELQPSLLWRLRGPILGLGGLQVVATALLVSLIAIAVGSRWGEAVAIGLILAMSSTAIVLQTLAEKGLMGSEGGKSAFAVLLFQDIAVIPILALLPLLAVPGAAESVVAVSHGEASQLHALPGWMQALAVVGVVVGILVAGRFLMRPVFRFIAEAKMREVFTAAALVLVIGIALAMTWVGLSPALGTFLAGVVLAESEYRHELESDIDPFKGLLLGLFFISVGASIDFALLVDEPLKIAGIVAGLIAVKLIVLLALGKAFRMERGQGFLFAFSLAQGGEFAFVLFSFAIQNQVLTSEVANPLVAAVALSMMMTPLLMIFNERWLQPRLHPASQERAADAVEESDHPVLIAGFGRFGQIVARVLSAQGIDAVVLDHDASHIERIRRFGYKVYYGDASRVDLLHAAGAEQAKVLVLAIDDRDRANATLEAVKKHFPHLKVLVRAFDVRHYYELKDRDADHINRELFGSSLEVGVEVLRLLGYPAHRALRAARQFREFDERAVDELYYQRGDEKLFVTESRKSESEMIKFLRADRSEKESSVDHAWDSALLAQARRADNVTEED